MSSKIALLIGISEYGEGIPSLSAPINDVAGMKRVLENPHMGGFDQVKTLPNPDLPAMQKAVQQIFANCHKDDLVLLFFSGHGITDDNNRLYLATQGTSKEYYKATSVSASFIQDISLESYAKRQVIVLDCCYSGAFAEGWQAKTVGLDLQKELGAEGRVVLTSSTATQTSFQQEDEDLSLYTQYLIEGIETGAADKEGNGKIYAHELHNYAKAKVQEVKPKQKPEIIIDKEGFNILLSQAPVDDPELDYRKLVERYAIEGQITVAGNYILQLKRQELEITDEKSDEIINEVLAPYRKRIENIALYKRAFIEAVEQKYPLTERLLSELKDLEDVLGLEDQDIAEVKEQILAEKQAEYQNQQEVQQQDQEDYANKLQQYEQELKKAVEQEYPLSENTRNQINILQQSLGLRQEDIERIEQQILAAKNQEKIKEEDRQKEQEAERAKQLELQKQREQEEYQQRLGERQKREEEERLRQQQPENILSPSQPRQVGIFSSKKARRSVLLGSTALGLVVIFSGITIPLFFLLGNLLILTGSMYVWRGGKYEVMKKRVSSRQKGRDWKRCWSEVYGGVVLKRSVIVGGILWWLGIIGLGDWLGIINLGIVGYGYLMVDYRFIWMMYLCGLIVYLTSIYIGRW